MFGGGSDYDDRLAAGFTGFGSGSLEQSRVFAIVSFETNCSQQ